MKPEFDLERIEYRVEALETAYRRWRLLSMSLLMSVVPLFLVQCAGERVVRAQRFVVEDATGKPRATLAIEEEGTRLRLFDENGVRRASLSLAANGQPGLALFDENDKPRAVLEVLSTGPSLVLSAADGRTAFQKP